MAAPSQADRRHARLNDWIEDVEALVKKIGWSGRKLHVGGWSLGGGIAMAYAAKHPGDIASLTLVAPMSPYGFGATRDAAGTPTTRTLPAVAAAL